MPLRRVMIQEFNSQLGCLVNCYEVTQICVGRSFSPLHVDFNLYLGDGLIAPH